MVNLAPAHPGSANVAPFDAARTFAKSKFELALTSLVVVALVAGAVGVLFAALGQQAGHAGPSVPAALGSAVSGDRATALNSYNRAENGILDRDLYPFCLNGGGRKLVSGQDRPTFGQDSPAAAPDGQPTKVAYMLAGRTATAPHLPGRPLCPWSATWAVVSAITDKSSIYR